MNKLRRIHLYLGCAFAPLLTFFAISGIWQTFYWHEGRKDHPAPHLLALLSTLHKSNGLKSAGISNLSSTPFRWLVVAMAVSLLVTMVLGVIMAFRFGRGWLALLSLVAGFIIPIALVVIKVAMH
jgi:hypothetical protein